MSKKFPEYNMTEFHDLRLKTGLTIEELSDELGYSPRQLYRWESGEIIPKTAVLRTMNLLSMDEPVNDSKGHFTFIDLFAGIGGIRKGFENAGGTCLFTSEWDRFAQQTYHANYRDNRPVAGDITAISSDDIPEHDVLLAGFPCQPFSIAGVSKKNALGRNHGFACDAQGTLFFDVARVLEAKRPRAFMLENVKNLKGHDKGRTFDVIMNTLETELGYKVDYRVIDAQHFVPQHRERIVIVGFKQDVGFSFDKFHLPGKGLIKMDSVLHPENGTENTEEPYTEGKNALVNRKYTLSDKLWGYLQNYAAKHKAKGNGFGFGLVGPNDIARTLSARYYKDGSEILVNQGKKKNPRRLTPRECARLMGYDDDFKIPVSDTQAYKQFGNSVAVPVFSAVAKQMLPGIMKLS